ncbi:MAG: hypothetical protein COT25_01195 [Candidatus Kerfeldbacteria bacterium CG08_land_8_20_14_0_20_42_7]|uniref:Uncharacterized protein n=1 Tax=Candidatus Kerfeldbacteria bacterium CG08_land_8_20_14_0_20_42_7 TaxID=2014245 RepID=A0A2H0YVM5_9BACT|nr:MAG: hypothetical protein COT25_01195 [Candidatus Kerfeldbacteria bacterium CG08_land_8_20_14_0_20_42_7]
MNDVITKNIIELLGLENLPEEKKKALLDQMSSVVQSRIARRVDALLSEEQKEHFNKMVADGADENAINAYLSKQVPKFDEIATEEILKFKEEMVKESESIKSSLQE